MKRALLIALFSSLTFAAHASFELMMVADAGTGSVHRFDSLTGTYFGSFGAGLMTNIKSMAIDQFSDAAYVLENGGNVVSRWNYNTGEYLGTVAFGNTYKSIGVRAGGQMLMVSDTAVDRYSVSGNLQSTYAPPTDFAFTSAFGRVDDVQVLGMYNSITGEQRVNLYASLATSPFTTAWVTGAGPCRSAAASSTDLAIASNSGLGMTFRLDIGGFTYGALVANGGSPAAAVGHGRMSYFSGLNPGNLSQGIVVRWDSVLAGTRGSFGTGYLVNPVAMGIVVAPEPSTLLACGLGIAALVSKRRRSK